MTVKTLHRSRWSGSEICSVYLGNRIQVPVHSHFLGSIALSAMITVYQYMLLLTVHWKYCMWNRFTYPAYTHGWEQYCVQYVHHVCWGTEVDTVLLRMKTHLIIIITLIRYNLIGCTDYSPVFTTAKDHVVCVSLSIILKPCVNQSQNSSHFHSLNA